MTDSERRQAPDGSWWFRDMDNQWRPEQERPAVGDSVVQSPASLTHVAAKSQLPAGAWLAVIAGGLAALASFLPWVHFTTGLVSLDRNGWQLGDRLGFSIDGAIVMALGLVTLAIGIAKLTRSATPRYMQRSPIVTGIAIAAVPLLDLSGIHTLIRNATAADSYILGSVGFGVWLAVAAGVIAIVSGLILRSETAE